MTRLLTSAFACLLALPAAAQEPENIALQTFTVLTVFAPPPWVNSTDDLFEVSELDQVQTPGEEDGTGSYQAFLIPKGQDFDGWTERFTLTAMTPEAPAPALYAADVSALTEACSSVDIEHVVDLADHHTGVVLCGARIDDPSKGQVMILNQVSRHGTSVQVKYEVRGASFDVAAPETYIYPLDRIADALANMSATGIFPITD